MAQGDFPGAEPTWVFRHPARETLIVSGPERVSWLNGVVTCDVRELLPGKAAFGLALNRTGKIQSDLWLAAAGDKVFISAAPGTGHTLLQELQRMLIMEDAEIELVSDLTWLTVHGPAAGSVTAQLAAGPAVRASGEIALLQAGDRVLVKDARAISPNAEAERFDATVRFGSDADWAALRIEHGLPQFGVDYDARANPHDATLERRAVSWSKGCYLGQEVVCMQDMRGKAKHRFIALQVASDVGVAVGAPVTDQTGTEVGAVTSVARSPRFPGDVVLARLAVGSASEAVFVGKLPAQRIERGA